MKRNIFSISVLAIAGLFVASCKKNEQKLIAYTLAQGANVKIVHAMPLLRNPPVQIKLNSTRVSNNITYTTPFPGGGLNTQGSSNPDYLSLTPGPVKVDLSVPNLGTNNDSIPLFSGSITVEKDKFYSAYITDTGSNAQLVILEDDLARPDSGTTRYRFVNLIPNLAAVDLYFGANKVASNIAYKAVSPTFTLQSPATHAWALRPAGAAATTTAIATYTTGTVGNTRVMTVFSRGYSGVSSTDLRRPMISLLFNR